MTVCLTIYFREKGFFAIVQLADCEEKTGQTVAVDSSLIWLPFAVKKNQTFDNTLPLVHCGAESSRRLWNFG